MIFVVSVIVIFIAISVFFFFRAENLQRELLVVKREIKLTKVENKSVVESMALMINRNEEFARKRLEKLKERFSGNPEINMKLEMISPLINNYQAIASECLKGNGKLSKIVNQCYVAIEPEAYKNFTLFINKEGEAIKRLWLSNDLKGFISLVEMLLQAQEHSIDK